MDKPLIRTAQDLRDLPNYLESVAPLAQPLSRIVTGYYLTSEYPCGLKSCHQPHREGFLVELADGNVTNVGWKCGEGFGDKFTVERTRYAERELRPKAIRNIQSALPKLRGMQQEIMHLAAEADRLSQCKQGMRSLLPKLYRELEHRAHSGNDRVVELVERTKKDIDNLHEMNPGSSRERLRYREEMRGVLPGLGVIADNIREVVITAFTAKVEALLLLNVGTLSTEKLLEWERWALHLDDTISRARGTVTTGNQLFASESFRLMTYISTVDTERRALVKLSPKDLMQNKLNSTPGSAIPARQLAQSKKQRDIQKRLDATLRTANLRTR